MRSRDTLGLAGVRAPARGRARVRGADRRVATVRAAGVQELQHVLCRPGVDRGVVGHQLRAGVRFGGGAPLADQVQLRDTGGGGNRG